MKKKFVLIAMLAVTTSVVAQDDEANRSFEAALKYPQNVYEFTFDSSWRDIPRAIAELTELRALIFDHSMISELPKEVYSLPKLERIVFIKTRHLKIEALFNDIAGSNSVETLILDSIEVRRWPKIRTPILNIKNLHITNAGMSCLTGQIELFANLESISIEGNSGCVIPEQVRNLKRLVAFNISNCDFTRIPESLLLVERLEILSSKMNRYEDSDAIARQLASFKRMKTLVLDACGIEYLSADLCEMENIEWLSLADNKIAQLPEWLSCWSGLENFNVSRNRIRSIPNALWEMSNLKYLDLRDNHIETITSTVIKSPLIQIYLEGNPLDTSTYERLGRWFPGWIDVLH